MNGDDEYDDIYGGGDGDISLQTYQPPPQQAVQQELPPAPPPEPQNGQDEEDNLEVTLAGTEPRPADEINDDDFEVFLDEPNAPSGPAGVPSSAAAAAAAAGAQGGFRYSHVGGAQPPRPGARPYMDASAAAPSGQAPGSWAGGGRGGPPGLGRGLGGTRTWRPQFVPLGTTSIERDETLAFPESAQSGQLIKLPGQTRVTAEEYSEFTMLGNGGIFELDMDRVVDAPWKVPGVEISDFFNYGMTANKWRLYVREIQRAHAESRMQEKIRLYEPAVDTLRDPDMPPELAGTLAAKGLRASQTGTAGPAPPSAPPPQGNMPRQEAPDAILVLAGQL